MLRTMGAILLAFPLLDIGVTYFAAQMLGGWLWLWLLVAGVVGTVLIRRNASALLRQLAGGMRQGQVPLTAVVAGMKTGAAGLLLLLPGVVSDLLALLLLAWTPRLAVAPDVAAGVYEGEYSQVEPPRLRR